jgi:hypothetical protein
MVEVLGYKTYHIFTIAWGRSILKTGFYTFDYGKSSESTFNIRSEKCNYICFTKMLWWGRQDTFSVKCAGIKAVSKPKIELFNS